ncbi:MAG: Stf0 family sulfotransferase [Pseudolabrys sp.]
MSPKGHMPICADRGYAICTSPRAGSNFLCQNLTSTGVLGRPSEYFNGAARRSLDDPLYPDDPADQIRWILTKGATPNGVYGVKLFAYQQDLIAPHLSWTQALPALHFIYLERRDLLGQALSWSRALQTGQYRSTQSAGSPARYDASLILQQLREIVRERARWSLFFARTGIEPLIIYYEDLVSCIQAEIDRIATLVELNDVAGIDPSQVNLKIQRDDIMDSWRKCFLRDHGDPNHVDQI